MKKVTIIADEKIPFLRGVLEPFAEVIYLPGDSFNQVSIKHADALLVRTRTRCDESLLEDTSVQFIASATIGFDHIDMKYCDSKKIAWYNAPGCNSASVNQYLAATLVELALQKDFRPEDKTLGIVGVGNVGSKVHRMAESIGMKVRLNDPPRARTEGSGGFVSLDEIIETCDIVTLHVPLNMSGGDKTYHLFDDKTFRKMKPGCWLINTSRGEVVETGALKSALTSGKLNGAVIDVWHNEPFIDPELLRRIFISTPHIAGYSADGKANGTSQVVRSLAEHFDIPLRDFYPQSIPAPEVPEIIIDHSGLSRFQVITQCILHSYPIMKDHNLLQNDPGSFELQRGNYPVRREFRAYTVKLLNPLVGTIETLESLGFNVLAG
ncbi:MAG: 4-phosphoerythronate dehydrogenase PdxB [Bacteroidota bacterium]